MAKMSEYGRAFSARGNGNKYVENRQYRFDRRQREHLHTPICWDSDSDSDSDMENATENQSDVQLSGYDNLRLMNEERINAANVSDDDVLVDEESTVVKLLNDDEEIRKCAPKQSPLNVGILKGPKKAHIISTKAKPRCPKPSTSGTPTPKGRNKPSSQGRLSAEPPFIPYGCRDEHSDVGRKLTHNIRASADIHLSALKAKRRLDIEAKLRQEKLLRKNVVKLPKGSNLCVDDGKEWLSEYQLRFPAYDTNVYVQHLPSRRHNMLK